LVHGGGKKKDKGWEMQGKGRSAMGEEKKH